MASLRETSSLQTSCQFPSMEIHLTRTSNKLITRVAAAMAAETRFRSSHDHHLDWWEQGAGVAGLTR
ncbi:hypothetical protein MUK42_21149 [Musa troglodytarum]|uniref:Uncharacterized protein n=1 Tax=Musa troglodytarum TaxID=320322 RepID=A0A9E7HUB6_9LILI|nr:hypothetical protein MUK42_21149 [Musa troglodytarum]